MYCSHGELIASMGARHGGGGGGGGGAWYWNGDL